MNSTPVIVLNGKPNILPALSQFRLHPMVLACAAALAFGATTFPVRAADCSVNGTTYANCTQGQAGTSGINASGAEGTTGSNGNTAGNPTNAGTNGNNGGDATNTATSGGAGDVVATGGTLNVTTGSLLAGGAGGAGGNANGGNGGNGGWPVQGSNANGGNGGDAGLSGVAQNGGMGGNAIVGSGFSVNNDGSIFGGAGGAGGNALGGAGGRGGQGANNFGHSGDGGDGTAGGIAGNGAAGGIAVTGSHFELVSQGIIRGGNGGGAGLATGGAAGSTDLAGAPGGTMGSAGQAGADGTAGSYGAGGVAVISTGSSTITTSNIIAGGLAGDRKTQANAIELSGGNNTLTLESGYSFVGNVISSGGDTLVLGGETNSSFSVASLAASSPSSWTGDVQYYGFSNYVKTGNSTWTLSGSTTEVTAWNINAGTLSVSSDSNLGAAERALTFGSGTLENTAVISTARDMLLNTSGTLKTDANLTATGQISGLGSLVKTGAAGLILTNNNTYAGGTTINAGTLQIGNGGTTGSVVGDITNNSALSFNRSNALTYGGVISGSGSLVKTGNDVLTLTGDNTFTGATTISAGTLQIGNGGTSGSVVGDIINNSALSFNRSDALTYGGVISGSGSLVKAGNDVLTLTADNTFTGDTTISAGTLQVGNGGTTGAMTGNIINNSALSFNRSDALTYSGVISGSGSLSQAGNDVLALTGDNTYAGGTTISAGTLQIGNGGTTGSVAGNIINNSTLVFNRSDALTYDGVISGSGSLNQAAIGVLTLTGDNTFTGGTTISAGTLQIGNGGTTGSVAGDIVNNSALSFNRSDALTYSGVISGSGSLSQAGNDVLTLTGDNTYAGGTTISAGTLQIGNGGTTGSVAGDIINNSALSFNRSDALAYGGVIFGSGSVVKAGNDVLTLTGNNTFTGDTTISAGTLQIGNGGTTGAIAGNIINNSVLSFNRSGILAYDGVISGSGSLVKTGNSMLILTGDNTFTGDTTISAGTLVVGNNTTGSVAGNIINNSALMFNRSDALTYGGVISGSGSLNQAGGGALTLTGNNTYTGGTVVNWGTLILQGVNAAGTGDITNNSKVVFQGANGEFSHGIYGTGSITFSGGSEVIADTESSVSAVNIDAGSKLTLLDSQVWQAGNGFSNAGTLVLSHLSRLLGNVDNSGVLALSNQQNVTSFVDGNFTNRGSLVLNPSSTSAGNNLIINGDYVGGQGSSLSLGAVLADDNSLTDQLTILGNSSGTSTLYMVNEKGRGGQTLQGLKLITVQGTSDAVFTQGNRITAGLYDYSLVKKENDWYLDSYTNQVRPEAASYAANLQAANTLFTLSLHDRAGETQYEDLVTGETRSTSMWMRNEGGRSKVSMTDGQNNTNTNRYVLQLGGDVLQVSSEPLGKFNLGVMAGYANARGQTYNSLKGYSSRNTITGYSTGIYSSWYANDQVKGGLYTDSWLQYNWFRNQVNGQEMAEEKYDSRGLTASLETGYDWLVNSWTTAHGIQNTLWLQPHAQAIWMGVKADGHTENQGSYVEGLGNNNVQTKLGLRAYLNGKSELDQNTARKFQPYVEANWVYNTNLYGVRIDGVDDHIKGARNVGELKTGVEAKLTERLSIQGGVSGQIGGNSYSDIAASLGGKFNF
ncbi:autotransporter outer membrane beta-barrel domain-containing protein [Yersinia kristensenii]|uniref:autotransporter outer membrane beta-barrel domain-containing protein n=1 Tax=Yersinia kristensenii TaxID=28152 RepID=UPI001C60FB7A|nr:autotransporter outer membrane beta-barrel domain-containing protein [Yersinia kristensenii]MBW5824972.1 autotransporter outer membrane beta-barrel domain-containing protein [Yersinia kristensenii]